MATTIIPLHTIDTKEIEKFVKQKSKEADSYAKIAEKLQGIPGVPDIKQMVKDKIDEEVDELKDESKAWAIREITQLILEIMARATPSEETVKKINAFIKQVNIIIDKIKVVLGFLKTIIGLIFPIIIVLTVAFVIAKVITLIPSFGGGFGAVVVATFPGTVASGVKSFSQILLGDIKPLPAAILATILSLLSIYDTLSGFINMLAGFFNSQILAKEASQVVAGKTASDFDNSSTDEEDTFRKNGKKIKPKPFDVDDMGAFADNIIERLSISSTINSLEAELLGIGTPGFNMGDCTLPNGEVVQMTAEDCEAAGGTFGYGSPPTNPPSPPDTPYTDASGNVYCWEDPPGEWVCCGGPCDDGTGSSDYNTQIIIDGLKDELNEMGGVPTDGEINNLPQPFLDLVNSTLDGLGSEIITSLINPDPDITVEEATKNFGVRYGFYQQEINED
jgi:hypothetical protein